MKAFMTLVVFVAGLSAHAAINPSVGCTSRPSFGLAQSNTSGAQPVKTESTKSSPVQQASGKTKSQGT